MYSDIRSDQFFFYEYIRTFIRVKFVCRNIFGYSFVSVLECRNHIQIFVCVEIFTNVTLCFNGYKCFNTHSNDFTQFQTFHTDSNGFTWFHTDLYGFTWIQANNDKLENVFNRYDGVLHWHGFWVFDEEDTRNY